MKFPSKLHRYQVIVKKFGKQNSFLFFVSKTQTSVWVFLWVKNSGWTEVHVGKGALTILRIEFEIHMNMKHIKLFEDFGALEVEPYQVPTQIQCNKCGWNWNSTQGFPFVFTERHHKSPTTR